MPRVHLTEITIRNLAAPEKGQRTYLDDGLPGFGVRVSQGGTRVYTLMHGPERKLTTIGRVDVIPLAKARQRAKEILAAETLGLTVETDHTSFDEARRSFLKAYKEKNRPSTAAETERLLARLVFKKPVAEITTADITKAIDRLSAPSERQHVFVAARTFFNWCVKRHLIGSSPLAGLDPPGKPQSRERVLSEQELRAVWNACQGTFGDLVRLLVLTGQRVGQVAALTDTHVDFNTMMVSWPAIEMKGNRPHTIPLGDKGAGILKQRPKPLLFAGDRGKRFANFSNMKKDLDSRVNIPHWTLHDLRRTFATEWAKLGIPPHVTERMLAHTSGTISGVAAIYNRHSYLPEMREAVSAFEDHLARLMST